MVESESRNVQKEQNSPRLKRLKRLFCESAFFHQNLKNQIRRLKCFYTTEQQQQQQQEDSVVVCIYCCSSSSLFSLLLWFLNESRRRQQSFLSLFLTLTNNLRVLLPRFMNDVNSSSNFGKGYLAPGSVSQEVTGSSG